MNQRASQLFHTELESYLEGMLEGFVAYDAGWVMTYMNPAAECLLGRRRESVLGLTWHEAFPHAVGNALDAMYQRVMRTRVPERVEHDYTSPYGKWLEVSAAPTDGGGVGVYFRDITDHKREALKREQAERALREAAEFNRSIVDSSRDCIKVLDLEGRLVSMTESGRQLLCIPDLAHYIGRSWIDFWQGAEREAARAAVADAAAGGTRSFVGFFRILDGTDKWWDVQVSPIRGADGRPERLLAVSRDVTERKRAEDVLRESEQRLRLALEAGRMGTWEWHLASGRVSWSAGLEAIHGYEPGAFPGTVEAYSAEIYPEDRDHVSKVIGETMAGKDHVIEYRIVRRDGAVRWVEGRGKLFRDESGNPLRLVGVCTDVTARKDAEASLRASEQALREADRRKDEFLAMLAHELRNPLAPISNAVQLMKAKAAPDPELAWSREVIERQLRQMTHLLDDLLDVSRITRGKTELRKARIALSAVVDSAIETSRPLIEAGGHELEVTLPGKPIFLEADPVRLAQIFSNLLNNAAKYTPDRGHIQLHVRPEGDHVSVTVSDDGIGVSPDMLPRLFEMFSQAEPARERSRGGLGIGLALARTLVQMHGGSIEARSDGPGRGTQFVVRLPVLRDEPAAEPQRGFALSRAPVKKRLLIADDLKDNAESLALLMRRLGHEVRTAHDGDAAIALGDEFHPEVVLLDLGMPRLDGYETCRRMRERPWGRGAFIVALTGWGQEEDRRRTQGAGVDHHMVKPADAEALLSLLAAPERREGKAAS